jgi:hypothetical protein
MDRLRDSAARMKVDLTVTDAIGQRIDTHVTGVMRPIRVTHMHIKRPGSQVTAIEDCGGSAAH